VTITGSGKAELSGKVKGQEVNLSGSSKYDAKHLESEVTIIDLSGSGDITVWATETLELSISGSGDVDYYGTPRLIQRSSGSSNITGHGETP
jgi:hypothetical protein